MFNYIVTQAHETNVYLSDSRIKEVVVVAKQARNMGWNIFWRSILILNCMKNNLEISTLKKYKSNKVKLGNKGLLGCPEIVP